MDHYPTVLDPVSGLLIFMVLDVVVLLCPIYLSSRLGRWEALAHFVAILFLLGSPFILAELTIPKMQPNESPGPGDGLELLPLFAEAVILVGIYVIYLCLKLYRSSKNRIQVANARQEVV